MGTGLISRLGHFEVKVKAICAIIALQHYKYKVHVKLALSEQGSYPFVRARISEPFSVALADIKARKGNDRQPIKIN